MGGTPGWTDEHVEQVIGRLLRVGVLVSAAVIALGGAVYLSRHGQEHEPVERLGRPVAVPGEGEEFSRPAQVPRAVLGWRGRGLIQLGVLLLVATPVARVAYCAYASARRRDAAYVAFTLVVLAVLTLSLFGG